MRYVLGCIEGGFQEDTAVDYVLHMLVCHQKPCLQVRCTVQAPYNMSLSGLVICLLHCHLSPVRYVVVPSENVVRLAQHFHHLLNICLQVHLFEQTREDVKLPLD